MKRSRQPRQPDERVRRTRYQLGQALIKLIQEKSLDRITVQEVLDCAGVSRSTFYVHFRGKDDLLLSQFEAGLEMWSTLLSKNHERSVRVAPVAEFFAHAASAKRFIQGLRRSGRLNDNFELAQGYFVRSIEQRLRELNRVPMLTDSERRLRAVALAGSLLSLMRCWLDCGSKESPQAMDKLFHQMVWNGLRQDDPSGQGMARRLRSPLNQRF
jgi:AcrR family transcriptional regulator